jgi:hypothetical protein
MRAVRRAAMFASVIMTASANSPADAVYLETHALVDRCSVDETEAEAFCQNYIRGVAEGLAEAFRQSNVCRFVMPGYVTDEHLAQIVMRTLSKSPRINADSTHEILFSLQRAFPCPDKDIGGWEPEFPRVCLDPSGKCGK